MGDRELRMALVVDRSGQEPVYEQIARQIRETITSGDLSPGAPLPPVRVVASDLGVNLNTVARAYRLLEEQGFVRIRDRAGAEVAAPAPRPDAGERDRLQAELRGLLARMRQAGVGTDELKRLAEREIGLLAGERPRGR